MKWIAVFFLLQMAYSFGTKELVEAAIFLGLFAIYLIGCLQLGEWTSPKSALGWLIRQRQAAIPVVAGPLIYLVALVYSGKYSLPFAVLEAAWIYFFFHASLAIWDALVELIKKR